MITTTDPTAHTVQIRAKHGPVQIAADHVYFAFGDGRFAYDCIRCGSKCCRGYGYHLNRGAEVHYQLSIRPYTRLFMDALPGDPVVGVKSCPPACFFLTDGGQCGIHVEHGYDAKPETCRLFPFNSFRQVGEYLVVLPHPDLCPLEVLTGDVRSAVSDHQSLLGAMTSHGIAAEIVQYRPILKNPDRAIGLERRIAELSERYIDPAAGTFQEFIDQQFAITRAELGHDGRVDGNSFSASTLTEHAQRLLGVDLGETLPVDANVDRTIIALTPYLRSRFVFVRDGNDRNEAPHAILDRVPALIVGVHLMARLAARAGMSTVTFQTVTGLLSRYNALIWCLAHAADVMVWRSGLKPFATRARQRPFATKYVRVIRDLMPSGQRKQARTLADVLCEHNVWDGAERMAFLSYAGGHLARLVVPLDGALPGDKVARPLGATLQLRALEMLPDSLFERACIGIADLARKGRAKGK